MQILPFEQESKKGLEKLCRYVARPPLSNELLVELASGDNFYASFRKGIKIIISTCCDIWANLATTDKKEDHNQGTNFHKSRIPSIYDILVTSIRNF